MLYRLLDAIRIKGTLLEQGEVLALTEISKKDITLLLKKGRISEVKSPPLSIIPGWSEKAKMYVKLEVKNVTDLADRAPVLPVDTVEEDLEEALTWTKVLPDNFGESHEVDSET